MSKEHLLKGHAPTQFPNQNPRLGGRPISIRNQLKDLLEAEGQVTMPANQVLKINEDGSVILKLPTQMQLAMKLSSWAMSKKGNDSLKAIQMIMDSIDGKAVQPIDMEGSMVITQVAPQIIQSINNLSGSEKDVDV